VAAQGKSLSGDEYCDLENLNAKTAPAFESCRESVYDDVFTPYESLKKQLGLFDVCDLVQHLFPRIRGEDEEDAAAASGRYGGLRLDDVVVDECQDFSVSTLALFFAVLKDPNRLFIGGDSAQTIASVSFRFENVRQFLRDLREQQKTAGDEPVKEERLEQLLVNYRCHDRVVDASNACLEILEANFELRTASSGEGGRERAHFNGQRPVLLEDNTFSEVRNVISRGGNERITFGAHQCVIVRSDEVRETLPPEVRENALVLTPRQAKGLEFNDVILYNFFKDSPADAAQWNSLARARGITCELTHAHEFDPRGRHLVMESETKMMYVALTRARTRVFLFDEDVEKRRPFFALLEQTGRGRVHAGVPDNEERGLAEASNENDWLHRGYHLLKLAQDQADMALFHEAAKCFNNVQNRHHLYLCRGLRLAHEAVLADADQREKATQAAFWLARSEIVLGIKRVPGLLELLGRDDLAAEVYRTLGNTDAANRIDAAAAKAAAEQAKATKAAKAEKAAKERAESSQNNSRGSLNVVPFGPTPDVPASTKTTPPPPRLGATTPTAAASDAALSQEPQRQRRRQRSSDVAVPATSAPRRVRAGAREEREASPGQSTPPPPEIASSSEFPSLPVAAQGRTLAEETTTPTAEAHDDDVPHVSVRDANVHSLQANFDAAAAGALYNVDFASYKKVADSVVALLRDKDPAAYVAVNDLVSLLQDNVDVQAADYELKSAKSEARINELTAAEERARAERAKSKARIDELEAALSESNARNDAVDRARAESARELAQSRARNDEIEAALSDSNARIDAVGMERAESEARMARERAAIVAAAAARIDELRATADRERAESNALIEAGDRERDDLEAQIEDLYVQRRRDEQNLMNEKRNLEDNNRRLESQRNRELEDENDGLLTRNRELEDEARGLRHDMHRLKQQLRRAEARAEAARSTPTTRTIRSSPHIETASERTAEPSRDSGDVVPPEVAHPSFRARQRATDEETNPNAAEGAARRSNTRSRTRRRQQSERAPYRNPPLTT